jgi:hypothetical protein
MTSASAAHKLAQHVSRAEASRPEMACVLTRLPSIPPSPAFICQIATLSPLQHSHFHLSLLIWINMFVGLHVTTLRLSECHMVLGRNTHLDG